MFTETKLNENQYKIELADLPFQNTTGTVTVENNKAIIDNKDGDLVLNYLLGRRARILNAKFVSLNGTDFFCRLDVWMHENYRNLTKSGRNIDTKIFADEVEETIKNWVDEGKNWDFFAKIKTQTLQKHEYVNIISNLYQFVRHTTRVIGKAIGHSKDPELRKHWINHLNGEINHEIMIEFDMKALGENVEYMKNHMSPNAYTMAFMSVQESIISYYNDPILMMASPLAAEAVTAHLDSEFEKNLYKCVETWGDFVPKKVTKFLISHMNTDGGVDGHWQMSIDYLPKLLKSETDLAKFLVANETARNALTNVFTKSIIDLK